MQTTYQKLFRISSVKKYLSRAKHSKNMEIKYQYFEKVNGTWCNFL